MSKSNYLVLSCDGGGIKGLITSLLIEDLAKECKDFLPAINLFTGTSTGGIIALGLASGLPPEKLVDIYGNETTAKEIFTELSFSDLSDDDIRKIIDYLFSLIPSLGKISKLNREELLVETKISNAGETQELNQKESENIVNLLQSLFKFVTPKYNNKNLRKVLEENLNKPLSHLEKNVLVTTFQLEDKKSWRPIAITNLTNTDNNTKDDSAIEAALCTSAAPTFFPPYQHSEYGYCIDGGVFANDPSTLAIIHLQKLGYNLDNIKVLSLGTGQFNYSLPIANPYLSGPLEWFFPYNPTSNKNVPGFPLIPTLLMDASSILDANLSSAILNDSNYKRANVVLDDNISLDSVAQIPKMREITAKYISSSEWKAIKDWVKTSFLA